MRFCVSNGAMKGLLSVIGRLNGTFELVYVSGIWAFCIKMRSFS